MNSETIEQFKMYAIGAGFGAAVAIMIGFGLGGWLTGGRAADNGAEFAQAEVTAAILPYCVDRARRDPNFETTLQQIKKAGRTNGIKILLQAGWALKPESDKSNFHVARACMEALAEWN